MRHKKAGYQTRPEHIAPPLHARNLVTSVIVEERVETTFLRRRPRSRLFEKMITLGKRATSPRAVCSVVTHDQ